MPDSICKICKKGYTTMQLAASCEANGPAPTWPEGLIFQVLHPACGSVIFAIAHNVLLGHANRPRVWVTRDDGGTDTLKYVAELPGYHHDQWRSQVTFRRPEFKLRAFGRMVAHLEQEGIEPYVWNGRAVVPLPEDWYK